MALERTRVEKRVTAHAMALVAAAVVAFHDDRPAAARAAAERALDFATTSGLGEYHGLAPALAIRALSVEEDAAAEAAHAVALARKAATTLGLAFALVVAGDVLLRDGLEEGRELLAEAQQVVARCPDAGITVPLLERAAAKHRLSAARRTATDLVEPLSDRELAVLRHLPTGLSLPAIARELYVSPNTIKTQCGAIYRKLGVASRDAAVQAARERRLI